MNLIIDQGNTSIKMALFQEDNILEKIAIDNIDRKSMRFWLEKIGKEKINVLVCSVVHSIHDISFLNILNQIDFNHQTKIPLTNKYKSPESLGLDRLANAVGAWSQKKDSPILVIDCGTCIKYDLIDVNGNYLGGIISPGMNMRFKALSNQTDKLPLLSFEELNCEFGTDTASSIRFGVQEGIIEEINGFIIRYKREFPSLTIFMTGGDSKYFDKAFKNDIFADPYLTLKGLNEILNYNVE